ncbi:TraB/GumN family protein [Allosphingosinicella flava]|uniref:TraB/GumN family protein n=1 Tax=Allosphingosinicella flava TaxID=2771430 RepID=A0A7T2GI25_9SPHN|nr:TraB/GumN family protein [Sphingosinicella flava]QPQ54092.1 TraB/GumN family protein [Sphingosinicella flava]
MKIKMSVAAILTAITTPALSAPALWSVSDSDSTIYMFGTSHGVRPDAQWQTPALVAAIAASNTLWLEIKELNPSAAAPLVQSLGLDTAKPLSSKLSPDTNEKLKAFVTQNGLPAAQIEMMKPWLAAATVGRVAGAKAGLDFKAGADLIIKDKAEAEGDKIDGFDSVEQQVRYLADLPETDQIAFLESALDRAADNKAVMVVADAWEKGDVETIDTLLNKEVKSKSKLLYDRLIVQRNRRYADSIKALLNGAETHFVAIGAAHLVGADSIQNMLAGSGITIKRVQ